VISAWNALLEAKDPKEILSNRRLLSARQEINEEVEKRTHTPPKFSKDGKIAVLKIDSQAQVHPVIATRWVRNLHSCYYNV
jgi:CCR4-NOT transcriptional regulation complex NOT5 subunit